jgi:hypothetical protein
LAIQRRTHYASRHLAASWFSRVVARPALVQFSKSIIRRSDQHPTRRRVAYETLPQKIIDVSRGTALDAAHSGG